MVRCLLLFSIACSTSLLQRVVGLARTGICIEIRGSEQLFGGHSAATRRCKQTTHRPVAVRCVFRGMGGAMGRGERWSPSAPKTPSRSEISASLFPPALFHPFRSLLLLAGDKGSKPWSFNGAVPPSLGVYVYLWQSIARAAPGSNIEHLFGVLDLKDPDDINSLFRQ